MRRSLAGELGADVVGATVVWAGTRYERVLSVAHYEDAEDGSLVTHIRFGDGKHEWLDAGEAVVIEDFDP